MFPRGFTMFELLVVVLMAGILAALAMPAYRHQVLRVNRSEAMTLLLQVQGAEESHYLRHDTYTATIEEAPPLGLGMSATSATNKYRVAIALASDGQSYIATASPMGIQSQDLECQAFSIDARGRRAVTGSAEAQRCWR
jgi:type IV pilus assembly protein PilE